ncbi:MAG TPA: serine/threonine-protein kinase, partial [Pyrinomonadaceae bacterium]|nr:serine/threonine-protein kinase [Pyrinomonadaceae bacterium]
MPDSSHSSNSVSDGSPPDHIAHYRILRRLGKGGMGEVLLGEDTKQHGRKVALKVLPEELTQSESRLRRFRQEARAILALNHPNIITVYEIGETEDKYYIATEYIEGETLRQCLWREPLKLDEALGVAIQVTMALEAAHAEGIVHRDIKPENIMLREDRFVRDRIVKVLDFGLAKLTDRDSTNADPEAVTIPISETNPGIIMGTSGYMSPEQAEGDVIDTRSDVFSLGVVLYEMIAGQPPFKGRTDSHTRVSIIDHEPSPLSQHVPDIPRQLDRIVAKALAKDKLKRYQTITDLKLDLEQLRDEVHTSTGERTIARRQTTRSADTETIPQITGARSQVETVAESAASRASAITKARRTNWLRYGIPAVLAAVSIGIIVYFSRATPSINSVAILPFVNDTKDPNAEYLSDGITESITNTLSQLPNLRVMSRNAAFRFKSSNMDPVEVGRNLNVGAVLTGRLVTLDQRLVIKTELIKVADGSQIWGDEYNSSVTDILSV